MSFKIKKGGLNIDKTNNRLSDHKETTFQFINRITNPALQFGQFLQKKFLSKNKKTTDYSNPIIINNIRSSVRYKDKVGVEYDPNTYELDDGESIASDAVVEGVVIHDIHQVVPNLQMTN